MAENAGELDHPPVDAIKAPLAICILLTPCTGARYYRRTQLLSLPFDLLSRSCSYRSCPTRTIFEGHLGCCFARFRSTTRRTRCGEVSIHFLQARGERVNLLFLAGNRRFLLL
jgi:transposase